MLQQKEWILRNGERRKLLNCTLYQTTSNSPKFLHEAKRQILATFLNQHDCDMFVVEFHTEQLDPERLFFEVETYKSKDGQYVYEGTFMSREYIEAEVMRKMCTLVATFDYTPSDKSDEARGTPVKEKPQLQLPCQIGQTVYFPDIENKTIDVGYVRCFDIQGSCNMVYVTYKSGLTFWHSFEDFGDDVFLVEKDAEDYLDREGK